tara:strand:- start:168 stop:467 length:300 start_codon:yes stop_codon:yes gene_type:complete
MLIHSVFFYLKPELSAADRAAFAEGVATLGTISALEAFYLGRPAATEKRPVIDDTYDYAITCVLADVAAQNAYQVDPIHLAFIAAHKDKWATVKIYDAE